MYMCICIYIFSSPSSSPENISESIETLVALSMFLDCLSLWQLYDLCVTQSNRPFRDLGSLPPCLF